MWEDIVYGAFVLDLFLNFVFAYVDKDGMVVSDPRRIAWRYARTWLIFDIAACLPLDYALPDGTVSKREERRGGLVQAQRQCSRGDSVHLPPTPLLYTLRRPLCRTPPAPTSSHVWRACPALRVCCASCVSSSSLV